jgi:GGDEF domain-containing protein
MLIADHFKRINDSSATAPRPGDPRRGGTGARLPALDQAFRFGGEEFVVI